jgi:beta-glucanase (GH16 family)
MFGRFKKVNFLVILFIAFLCFGGVFFVKRSQIPSTPQRISSSPAELPSTPFFIAPSISSARQAMPIGDIDGWHQVFDDDFNGTTLNTANWGAYAGQPGGDTTGWWDPSHVVVNDGLLTLKGYQDAAAKPGVFVTGGIGMIGSHAQTYGKYLVRMRIDKGVNVSSIALLWPKNNVWPPEVDFNEDWDGNRMRTFAWFHCGSNGNDNCRIHNNLTGYDLSQWHTLGVEWTRGKLVYTIDGITWATVTDSRVPSIPMVLDLQTQALKPESLIPSEVDMQIDWVVVYAPT